MDAAVITHHLCLQINLKLFMILWQGLYAYGQPFRFFFFFFPPGMMKMTKMRILLLRFFFYIIYLVNFFIQSLWIPCNWHCPFGNSLIFTLIFMFPCVQTKPAASKKAAPVQNGKGSKLGTPVAKQVLFLLRRCPVNIYCMPLM